ncbi:MAG TPA: DedA family protein [Terriglobales bacterium]|nr:DedA family protein [Terriglobales bacterium]
MDGTVQWVVEHGAPALMGLLALGVLGAPIPDETLLVLTGAMAARGQMHTATVLGAAFGGSCVGITVSYALGRFANHWLTAGQSGWRRSVSGRMDQASRWFHIHGPAALVGGYFLPGVRHLIAVVAGTSRLSYRTFALHAYTGALLWTLTFVGLGWFAGDEWHRVVRTVHEHLRVLKPVAMIVFAGFLIWSLFSRRVTPNKVSEPADTSTE